MVLTYFFGFVLSVLGYYLAPIIREDDGGEGHLPEKSVAYLKINFIRLFFDFCYFGYQSLAECAGVIWTMISAASSISNVILDDQSLLCDSSLSALLG